MLWILLWERANAFGLCFIDLNVIILQMLTLCLQIQQNLNRAYSFKQSWKFTYSNSYQFLAVITQNIVAVDIFILFSQFSQSSL